MPASDAEIAARPVCRTSLRSVSIPVSSSSISMPNCDKRIEHRLLFLGGRETGRVGNPETARRSREGPSIRPAISCPITAGCLSRSMASPSTRPTRSSTAIWATNNKFGGAFLAAYRRRAQTWSSRREAQSWREGLRRRPRCGMGPANAFFGLQNGWICPRSIVSASNNRMELGRFPRIAIANDSQLDHIGGIST